MPRQAEGTADLSIAKLEHKFQVCLFVIVDGCLRHGQNLSSVGNG